MAGYLTILTGNDPIGDAPIFSLNHVYGRKGKGRAIPIYSLNIRMMPHGDWSLWIIGCLDLFQVILFVFMVNRNETTIWDNMFFFSKHCKQIQGGSFMYLCFVILHGPKTNIVSSSRPWFERESHWTNPQCFSWYLYCLYLLSSGSLPTCFIVAYHIIISHHIVVVSYKACNVASFQNLKANNKNTWKTHFETARSHLHLLHTLEN